MFNKGYKVAIPAAGTILVCFFLSWATVSCSGQPLMEVSGWEIATGPQVDTGLGVQRIDATPVLLLVPVAALVVLFLAWWTRQHIVPPVLERLGLVVLGVLPVVVLWIGFAKMRQDAAAQGLSLDYRIGWWGTILGFLGIAAGGTLNWRTDIAGDLTVSAESLSARVKAMLPSAQARGAPPAPVIDSRSPPAPPLPAAQIDHAASTRPLAPLPSNMNEAPTRILVPQPAPAAPVLVVLTFLAGPLAGRRVRVSLEDVLIGRGADCDIQLSDPTASRRHARLRRAQGQWFVQDQGSAAGIVVNGRPVPATRLANGDVIEIGASQFRFETQPLDPS